MAFNLASISREAVVKAPRILLLAKEKVGKTAFSAGDRVENGQIVEWGLNRPVILPIKGEQGADDIPVAKFPVATEFDNVIEAIGTLATEEHDFQTFAIDSLTTLEEIVKRKVMLDNPKDFRTDADYIRYNNGPRAAAAVHRMICDGLDVLRERKSMCTIITAHIKHNTKEIIDPEQGPFSAWVADIPDPVFSVYARWADVVLYASTKNITKSVEAGMGRTVSQSVDVGNGQRFLFTRATKSHPSGGRGVYGHLPAEIPFDWYSFNQAVASAAASYTNAK